MTPRSMYKYILNSQTYSDVSMARNTTLDRALTRIMSDLTFKCLASPTLILNLRLLCSELEICSQLELAALPTLIINVWWLIDKLKIYFSQFELAAHPTNVSSLLPELEFGFPGHELAACPALVLNLSVLLPELEIHFLDLTWLWFPRCLWMYGYGFKIQALWDLFPIVSWHRFPPWLRM